MSYPIPSAGPTTIITSVSGLLSAHGLAGLVQLVYIRIGNEVMAQALGKLETALSATQSSLSVLTDLQGLHNQIAVGVQSAIPFDFKAGNTTYTYTTNPTSYVQTTTNAVEPTVVNFVFSTTTVNITTLVNSKMTNLTNTLTLTVNNQASYIIAYNVLASAYYGKPIDPYFAITAPGALTATPILATTSAEFFSSATSPATITLFNNFKAQLATSKASIARLITTLSGVTPLTPTGEIDPTTLLAKLRIVYAELPSGSFASCRAWVLDSYTSHGSSAVVRAGGLQQHITNAITAGESLNSSQNSAVRRYMFIFEQYYQSASSVMSALNQAMMSISRKLSG